MPEFTESELELIDAALDGYVLRTDEYLDQLDALAYDGLHVDEAEYDMLVSQIYMAEDIQDQIWDELDFGWDTHIDGLYEDDEWDILLDDYDELVAILEEEEEEYAS